MSRREFNKDTKRQALKRAGGLCEGMVNGCRCNAPLARGVEFDHVDADWFSKDDSLDNCACLCTVCHKSKTRVDVKKIAKSKRLNDRHIGIKAAPSRLKGAGFRPASAQRSASRPITRKSTIAFKRGVLS